MKAINSLKAPKAIGAYSQAIEENGMIYVSGQLPLNAQNGELVGEIKAATAQALNNLKYILEEANSSMANVVKTTIYLANMSDFADVNAVYSEFFSEPFPARACFQVAKLPKDALLEIECIAKK
ncbi:MAG: RidA family protein [Clostridia bacterium]